MPTTSSYDYAVIRVVPRVEREEFLNVGVILFCKDHDYIKARIEVDESRLRALYPAVDMPGLTAHLDAIEAVARGGDDAGPIGRLPRRDRFLILVAPRSTIIQVSPVHTGFCSDPDRALERLMDQMVRLGPPKES